MHKSRHWEALFLWGGFADGGHCTARCRNNARTRPLTPAQVGSQARPGLVCAPKLPPGTHSLVRAYVPEHNIEPRLRQPTSHAGKSTQRLDDFVPRSTNIAMRQG